MDELRRLGINADMAEKLNKQGIASPTPIQKLVIPRILDGKDIMAEAHTGTGKTLAFLIPMIQSFARGSGHISSLVLAPTRELAVQIASEAERLAEGTGIKVLSIFGGRDIGKQLRKLSGNVDMVVATPGRLIDHMRRNSIDLRHLKTLVLDEADQMLHIGFKAEIEMILKAVNKDRQMLCFSATLDSKVKKLAYRHMNSPVELTAKAEGGTLEGIRQSVVFSTDRWKMEALLEELDKENPFMAIIFCRTKRRADRLEEAMSSGGYDCKKLHGSMPQNMRARVVKSFRDLKFQYLIATDVASRGLDIGGITHIYNFDVPESPEIYIHRIGRTGRMGKDGSAVTFSVERDRERLIDIERAIKMKLPSRTHVHNAKGAEPESPGESADGPKIKGARRGGGHKKGPARKARGKRRK